MNKSSISSLLRSLRVLQPLDRLNYLRDWYRNRSNNQAFKREHPGVALPPDYLMYESFGLNYHKYFVESKESAQWILDLAKDHIPLQGIHVLDWGCGPGRVIRQMKELLDRSSSLYGTDYNKDSIAWCSANLPGIDFNLNGLEAKLPYASNTFDLIYGISIFTHLSEEKHQEWYAELHRVVKPGGIMILTTQGDHFLAKLNPEEKAQYTSGQLVVRGKVKEGHRTYSAFQPPSYMRELFAHATIEKHLVRPVQPGRALPQDVWIVRKK